jgi:putative Ca2+/H+ antiporter (TMEM165/GDT1 family)
MDYLLNLLPNTDWLKLTTTATTSFALIAAAEIGDKSQLVCMTLATRHKGMPVLLGAIAAFAFLNGLAVLFGAAIASWFPEALVAFLVGLLFTIFGIHALKAEEENDDDEEVTEKSGHGIFFSTFVLITFAEFGDKTQLAVVALSSTSHAAAVWLGSTLALTMTSALGVIMGRTILQKFPLHLLHQISGIIFLILGGIAFYKAATVLPEDFFSMLNLTETIK